LVLSIFTGVFNLSTSVVDNGYQGIQVFHRNSCIPTKKPKGEDLSVEENAYNRALRENES
jgi:hypothetical protein